MGQCFRTGRHLAVLLNRLINCHKLLLPSEGGTVYGPCEQL